MSYSVETTQAADDVLARLPAPLQESIIRRFLEFAKDPGVGASVSSPPLYAPGQLLQMEFEYDGMTCWAGVVFKYSQDEQKLIVTQIYVEFR